MKKILSVILVIIMMLSFAGCGEKGRTPSEKQMNNDLLSALTDEVDDAEILSSKTVKSFTEERTYEATTELLVNRKYSEWKYAATVKYTKYDQGWMLDSLSLSDGVFVKAIVPKEAEIQQLIEAYKEYTGNEDVQTLGFLAEMTNPKVIDRGDGLFLLTFDREHSFKDCKQSGNYSVYWEYDVDINMWLLSDSVLQISGEKITLDTDSFKKTMTPPWHMMSDNELTIEEINTEKCVAKYIQKFYNGEKTYYYNFKAVGTTRLYDKIEIEYYDDQQDTTLILRLMEDNTEINLKKASKELHPTYGLVYDIAELYEVH